MPGVMDLIWPGPFVVQSIHVVARLAIADLLDLEAWPIEDLATATEAHAASLKRVLCALTTIGVLQRTSTATSDTRSSAGRYAQTTLNRFERGL